MWPPGDHRVTTECDLYETTTVLYKHSWPAATVALLCRLSHVLIEKYKRLCQADDPSLDSDAARLIWRSETLSPTESLTPWMGRTDGAVDLECSSSDKDGRPWRVEAGTERQAFGPIQLTRKLCPLPRLLWIMYTGSSLLESRLTQSTV